MAKKKKRKLDLTKPIDHLAYQKLVRYRIESALRKLWLQSEVRAQRIARSTFRIKSGNRERVVCFCAVCETMLLRTELQVHHVEPVGSWLDLNQVVEKLLMIGIEDLQILCHQCHQTIHNGDSAPVKASRLESLKIGPEEAPEPVKLSDLGL